MRESIGTVSLLNFVIFFIFLVFAFLAGTMSYYKAFRVNNLMVSAIEKYEGFNQLASDEIDIKIRNLGYEKVDFDCPKTKGDGKLVHIISSSAPVYAWHCGDTVENTEQKGYEGYCVYRTKNDNTRLTDDPAYLTEQYDVYEVVTVITFKFPVVQDLLKLRVSAKTDRIYNAEASQNCLADPSGWCMNNCGGSE